MPKCTRCKICTQCGYYDNNTGELTQSQKSNNEARRVAVIQFYIPDVQNRQSHRAMAKEPKMAKVISHGDADPEELVPAGIDVTCYHCGCVFVTGENETSAIPNSAQEARFIDKLVTKPILSWNMDCPECKLRVCVRRP